MIDHAGQMSAKPGEPWHRNYNDEQWTLGKDRNVTDVSDELATAVEQRLCRSIGRVGIAVGARYHRTAKGTGG